MEQQPIIDFFTATDDDCWFSLPDISCARTFVNITLDHSDGDKGYAGGRVGEGFSLSSLALTTVESFDGKRDTTLFPSPVIFIAIAIEFLSFGPIAPPTTGIGSIISSNVQPDINDA